MLSPSLGGSQRPPATEATTTQHTMATTTTTKMETKAGRKDVPGNQKSSIWGVCAALGASDAPPRGEARSAPPFGVVSEAPGAVQTPKIDDSLVLET